MTATAVDRGVGARMRARAAVATELRGASGGPLRSVISTLRSEAPLVLRIVQARTPDPWATDAADVVRIAVTAGAAGPVGGDDLGLSVEVGAGSALVLSEISPTLLLPGPHQARSRTSVHIQVAAGGTLIWLPEPMIAAHHCDHLNDVDVHLEEGARFFMREEILLGRHGETSGQVRQRISVRLAGRPLFRQDLRLGTPDSGTPSVLGTHRAVGSAVIVDPAWVEDPVHGRMIDSEAAVLRLAGPAVAITAVARDNIQLRRHLAAGLAALGAPWDPSTGRR